MNDFDLVGYWNLFGDAIEERYQRKDRFKDGFERIETLYEQVRPGRRCRDITADDVLEIFKDDLPYVRDWTKPDRSDLKNRVIAQGASELIRDLNARYDLKLIKPIIYCFRELSLAALVLHHVYPEKYSMCSHHIASLLYITGHSKAGTVGEYDLEYCRELQLWGDRFSLNVVKTEFALWTWYRLAYYGDKNSQSEHLRRFDLDPWVRRRRAKRIEDSLKVVDKLGFARFFLDTDSTLVAIIAWREFEVKARSLLYNRR